MRPRPWQDELLELRRPPILALYAREARNELWLGLAFVAFMLLLLAPLARAVLPQHAAPSLFGLRLGAPRDPYQDVRPWLEPLLWTAGVGLIGVRARRRLRPALARADAESERLAAEAERAASSGEVVRSAILLQQAVDLAVDPQRRQTLESELLTRRSGGAAAPASTRPLPADGRVIDGGRIRLVRRLGEGSMGVVYLGDDTLLGRKLAVKALSTAATTDPAGRDRFLREAQALAQLSSPHVVQVYDLVEDGGRTYLCMELCEGEDLAATLRRRRRLEPREVARLGAQIAAALQAAHQKGIVHRDLKPANVLWADGETLKVADFGLAKLRDSSLTREGTVMGTPYYMAPEQVLGRVVDERADLYALGCVLFELATGRPPYLGGFAEVIAQHTAPGEPPDPRAHAPSLSPALATLITRLLAKDAAARPASAREVGTSLAELAAAPAPSAIELEGTFVRGH
jgi:hypothetical protein